MPSVIINFTLFSAFLVYLYYFNQIFKNFFLNKLYRNEIGKQARLVKEKILEEEDRRSINRNQSVAISSSVAGGRESNILKDSQQIDLIMDDASELSKQIRDTYIDKLNTRQKIYYKLKNLKDKMLNCIRVNQTNYDEERKMGVAISQIALYKHMFSFK